MDTNCGFAEKESGVAAQAASAAVALMASPASPDAPDALPESFCEPAVPQDLLAALPQRSPISWDDLLAAVDRARVLVIRLGGVPYSTLAAIGISFAINSFILVVVVGGVFFGPYLWAAATGKPAGFHALWSAETLEGGSGNGGFVITGTGGLGGLDNVIGTGGAREFVPAPVIAPPPPEVAEPKLEPGKALALLNPTEVRPSLGLPHPTDPLGDATPARRTPPKPVEGPQVEAPAVAGPVVAPPLASNVTGPVLAAARPANHNASALEGAGGTRGTGKIDRGGLGLGTGEEDGDEPTINPMKPNVGKGSGHGKGKGSGDELDRGASGASLAHPALLESPTPDIPLELQAKMYGKRVVFRITVDPDGRPSKIEKVESSGVPEIDALCQAAVARFKFRPKYEAGHPVAGTFEYGFRGPGTD